MANELTTDELRTLIGNRIPTGAIPAAWWVTTDPKQLAAYDRWLADYDAHRDKMQVFAETIGLTAEDAYFSAWGKTAVLVGFRVPTYMGHWNTDHPEYRPVPDGWRIDKKTDRLVPLRRTKADRDSQANKDFAAHRSIPMVHAYVTGLPTEIHLDDRDFGGTIYRVNYRRGDHCVWAYCGGDPDRQPEKQMNDTVDSSVWHRQKLSVLLALREDQEP